MKKILTLLLAVALIISIVGCSAQRASLATDADEAVSDELATGGETIDTEGEAAEAEEATGDLSVDAVEHEAEKGTEAEKSTEAATQTNASNTAKSKNESTTKGKTTTKTETTTKKATTANASHTHSWKKSEKTETSTIGGFTVKTTVTTYTCSCGAIYTETHSNGGGSYSETSDKNHTHSYTASVTLTANCIADGIKTYKCSCGASYTESIPATGHDWKTTTKHHDAVYETRNVTTTYYQMQSYEMYHLTQDAVDIGLSKGDFSSLRADAVKLGLTDLVKCIDAGRVGTYSQMKARYPDMFNEIDAPCYKGDRCKGHLYVCVSEVIYNADKPIRYNITLNPGDVEGSTPALTLNIYDDVTHVYEYCDDFQLFENHCSGGIIQKGYTSTHSFVSDVRKVESSYTPKNTNIYTTYLHSNWDVFASPRKKIEKVTGTEKYKVKDAYDETVTTCTVCGAHK